MANPMGQYLVYENIASNSHHKQVQLITVLRSGKIVDNKVAEKKDEKASPPIDSTLVKDNGAIQD
jgi:hypothetical protein